MSVSLLELAEKYLEEHPGGVVFSDLWEYITKEAGLTEEEARTKIARFYTNFMLDGRFVTLGENIWELRSRLTFDKVHIDMKDVYNDVVPDTLTTFCFGDFYTRNGLSIKQRELLSLVILTALGAEKQLSAHVVGALKAGNDKEALLAAMVQSIPYIGLANTMTTINLIKNADIKNYKSIYEE